MKAKIESTGREFQTQLKEIGTGVVGGRGTESGGGSAKPSNIDGTTSWAVFRRQFGTVTEHTCWRLQEKSTYLITVLQSQVSEVLHGISKGATYEQILEALEDCFGVQYLAAAYRSQLKSRNEGVRESSQ
jgi:hypothetical protein